MNVAAAGQHSVNCLAARGWRCRQRLSGAAVDDPQGSRRFGAAAARGRVAAVGKAKASCLGVGRPAGTRDNKSVAEIGERHHLLAVGGAACVVGGLE